MQDLVRGLQSQSISGHHGPWEGQKHQEHQEFEEHQEQVHDSGTESDEEELTAMSAQFRHFDRDLISMADPPAIRSSPPQPDADRREFGFVRDAACNSFGRESGIQSDADENFDEEPQGDFPPIQKGEVTFPEMSMNDELPVPGARQCRVRVIVDQRKRCGESESDMEIVMPPIPPEPETKRRAPKRPALDLDKMMRNRLDSSKSPHRKRNRESFSGSSVQR